MVDLKYEVWIISDRLQKSGNPLLLLCNNNNNHNLDLNDDDFSHFLTNFRKLLWSHIATLIEYWISLVYARKHTSYTNGKDFYLDFGFSNNKTIPNRTQKSTMHTISLFWVCVFVQWKRDDLQFLTTFNLNGQWKNRKCSYYVWVTNCTFYIQFEWMRVTFNKQWLFGKI